MQFVDKKLEDYCVSHGPKVSKECLAIEEYTKANVPLCQMLIGPMEAHYLRFLIKLSKAKKVIELGTFTGYSALAMAESLPENGEVITVDVNPETTQIAQSFWNKSPHGKKIKPVLTEGTNFLKDLLKEKVKNPDFDLFFIDADKENYPHYFQLALKLVRPGGLVIVDNCLWGGKVLNETADVSTKAIQQNNQQIKMLLEQGKINSVLLPIRDGIFAVQKVEI